MDDSLKVRGSDYFELDHSFLQFCITKVKFLKCVGVSRFCFMTFVYVPDNNVQTLTTGKGDEVCAQRTQHAVLEFVLI